MYYGYVGLVDGLVRRMRGELGENAVCIATGGLASIIAPEVDLIEHVDPDLTLQGLRMVWERNRPTVTPHEYCREIEAYLCRKNDGHLIRIVGPSFERVCGWAEQGIPFKIACQGIDACFVRYYAKGVRRRPVQIDFCENDILDAFEAWRRAVGVRLPGAEATEAEAQAKRRKRSLPEHLDRVCERVTAQARRHDAAAARVRCGAGDGDEGSGGIPRFAGPAARRDARADYGAGSSSWTA